MKKIFLYTLALSMSLFVFSCASDVELKPAPGRPSGVFFSASLVNAENPNNQISTLSKEKQSLDLKLSLPKMDEAYTPTAETTGLEDMVINYAKFKKLKSTDLELLPSQYYSINASEIEAGKMSSDVKVELKDFENIPYGNYILPVSFNINDQSFVHLVKFSKEGEYSALSETNKKNLPKNTSRKEPMKLIAYCETNDWDPRNFGNFLLKDSKKPLFDIVILFAANMNYNAIEGKRYLFFNDKLQPIVNNPEVYIKYLQDRGIKVLVDILPNHQGVGYENFQSKEEALSFVKDLKMWADKLGIDGYDLDEEYASYNVLPTWPRKGESVKWFLEAYRELMPDKLLTLYEFGFPRGSNYDKYFDYSWANYHTQGSIYGMPANKHSQYSVEAHQDKYISRAHDYATRNLNSGNIGLMLFNINGDKMQEPAFLSSLTNVTKLFYGEEAVFEGKYFIGPNGR